MGLLVTVLLIIIVLILVIIMVGIKLMMVIISSNILMLGVGAGGACGMLFLSPAGCSEGFVRTWVDSCLQESLNPKP